jgi:CHAT domain-containing protein/tetratricopeptide (TPR) repeat protein
VLALSLIAAPQMARSISDPVAEFITAADSVRHAAGEEALGDWVAKHPLLVGAAVGELVDEAIACGDSGDGAAEREKLQLAALLGALHRKSTGSGVPETLVQAYRAWTPKERSERARAKSLEREADEASKAGDYARAVELLLKAEMIYSGLRDGRSVAIIWGTLAVANWRTGDFDAAHDCYLKALAARRAVEDRILEGRALNGLGSASFQKGAFGEAAGRYGEAADLRRKTGDLSGLATSLTYLGNALAQLGRPVDAREAYEEAYGLLEEGGSSAQRFELLNSIANLNSDMGRLESANDAYGKAIAIAESDGDVTRQITCHNNLALNLASQYRYGAALDALKRVEELLAEAPDPSQTMLFHRNSGIVYLNIGELDLARDHFLIFLEASERAAAPMYQIEALINLGYLVQQFGDYERGLTYAKRAAVVAAEVGQPRLIRDAEVLTAELFRLMGRFEDSMAAWRDASKLDTERGAEMDVLVDRIGLANVLATVGRTEEAAEMFDEIRPSVEETGDGLMRVALYFGRGHAFEKTSPDSARYFYERALSIIERTRESIGGAEVRTGYLGGIRRYYYEEVARYYASRAASGPEWSALAFLTIEKSKARGLLELIESAVTSRESTAESAALDSLYRLDPRSADHSSKKKALTDRYLELRDGRVGSALGDLSRARVVSLDEVRKSLPKRTVLLAYALGDTASMLWAIDRDGHDLYELPNRGAIRADVERLRDALSRPGAGDDALRAACRRLYRILVAPAQSRLDRNRSLVIVPDGFLFEMPFEILLAADAGDNTPWQDLPFLARSFSPVYAPSASVYLSLRGSEHRDEFEVEILALGDPEFPSTGDAGGLRGAGLERLSATRSEVLGITAALAADRKVVLLGPDAKESALKRAIRDRSPRILHLATHGLIDPLEPAESSVALCADEDGGEDGFLHTLEILSLPLRSELVVLSACESARGKVSRGEGVVGLSRAFLACGARGTVASLWAVSDESTSILMRNFYARMLKEKRTAGDALNEARLALMKDPKYSHPYYWSPFVVIGSDRSPW